jgi:hypothetical protein
MARTQARKPDVRMWAVGVEWRIFWWLSIEDAGGDVCPECMLAIRAPTDGG